MNGSKIHAAIAAVWLLTISIIEQNAPKKLIKIALFSSTDPKGLFA